MISSNVFSLFSQAINWNGLLYCIQKSSSLCITAFLCKALPTNDFVLWATLNSSIFLVLLWIDSGLRKSIPRFFIEFSRISAQTQFTYYLLIYQAILSILSIPLFVWLVTISTKSMIRTLPPSLLYSLIIIFIAEGIIAWCRLMLHAQFFIKQFNLLNAFIIIVHTSLIIVYSLMQPSLSIRSIILIQAYTSALFACLAIWLLIKTFGIQKYSSSHSNSLPLWRSFITHSAIMWISTSIKSLSERNFLLILFGSMYGAGAASTFKIASESSLLFYRSVIKIIGTSDTTLLSYIETDHDTPYSMEYAFKKIITKVATLCIPLLGFLAIIACLQVINYKTHVMFQIFLLLTFTYLIEALAAPYERILEVKQQYTYLFYAYSAYCVLLSILYMSQSITLIGLLPILVLTQGVRLVSITIIIYAVQKLYRFSFPWHGVRRYVVCVGIACGGISTILLRNPLSSVAMRSSSVVHWVMNASFLSEAHRRA